MLPIRDRLVDASELRAALLGRTVHTVAKLAEGSQAQFDNPHGGGRAKTAGALRRKGGVVLVALSWRRSCAVAA
jgi:hypothetical protein